MEVMEVLERSLQMLEDQGWCKDGYTNEFDQVCVVRALYLTTSEAMPWDQGGRLLFTKAMKAIAEQTGMQNLALWNDHPERTLSQVKEVFRRAIAEGGGVVHAA